jgi:hypothetical protein
VLLNDLLNSLISPSLMNKIDSKVSIDIKIKNGIALVSHII